MERENVEALELSERARVGPKVQIRPVQEKDIESLRKLSFYQNLTTLPKNEEILVAEENGVILGAVSTEHRKIRYVPSASKFPFRIKKVETDAWVFRLFVREDRRSRGLGKKLLGNMVTHLRKKKIKTLYAGVAGGPFQEIAKKAFLAAGFTELGHCICVSVRAHRVCLGNLLILRL